MAIKKDIKENSSPVYFASIEVENVLCFKSPQKLDLCDANGNPAQWTVILGDNGVGKTTLLRYLSGMIPHQLINSISKHYLFSSSSKMFSTYSKLANVDARFTIGLNLNGKRLESSNGEVVISTTKVTNFKQTVNNVSVEGGDYFLLQSYGYGANRKPGETSLSDELSQDSCLSLFSDSEELINAEEWLLQADYAVVRSDHSTNKFKRDFNLIKHTLISLLPDIVDIRIKLANQNTPRPTVEFLTPYDWVSLSSLGLGYRSVIAWIVDLSARMIRDFPDSENPLSEPAVVLVDEIDLHLHPKWQRTIMSFLTERFPNVQFIVTAHSPLIVQAARNANIVLLRREGDQVVIDNNPEIIENWRVEQVLTSVFELPSTHPADIEPLIQERRKILAKSTLTKKDKQKLQELETKIGSLPTAESPADIQAMDIIRKAAKLLENKQSAE
jgi:energy-coupling factor transporter ATP-binding protein EcfA2